MFATDDQDDELIGMTLGSCKIIRLLGAGGMAKVYLANQGPLARQVALKVLPQYAVHDASFIERFMLEARTMARLNHPNIVRVYDAGQYDRWLYIVMEYIDGGDLRKRMQQSMKIAEAANIFCDIAEALDYAHRAKVIHRDVKPVNVLLDVNAAGQIMRAVLTDFGIAKVLETSADLTRAGAGVGTPEYMSPEQCRGVPVDHRADIYALGILLYEMLCGRPPFISEEYTAVAHSHVYDKVLPPATINRGINQAVQDVILKALQKEPGKRFQSAHEMARALDTAVKQPTGAAEPRALMTKCKECGKENRIDMNYCSRCGTHLRGGMLAAPNAIPGRDSVPGTCRKCGVANPITNRFCTHCGEALPQRRCAHCHSPVANWEHFCTKCGSAVPNR